MTVLGKKVLPPPEPVEGPCWRFHKPGFEINRFGQLRTVDIDTATRDYLERLRKESAP